MKHVSVRADPPPPPRNEQRGQLADELKQGKLQKRPQNWDFVPKITINSVV